MVKNLLKYFFIASLFVSANSFAESMSKSCSGFMRYCDHNGICSDEYFYLYAYQYVKFRNGQLDRYRNRFNFRGYLLGEEDEYQYLGDYTTAHLIYQGPRFDLAIPWNEYESIYKIDPITRVWEVLCRQMN